MKKNYLFLLMILAACNLISCEEDEKHSITFDKTSVTLPRLQATETIEVMADGNWVISSEIPSWLSIEPRANYSSPTLVTIKTIETNNEQEKREATIIFSSSYDTENAIQITQLGLSESEPFIELSDDHFALDLWGETKWINLTTNQPWEINSLPGWISISPSSGEKSERISISVNENLDMAAKETILTFKTKDGKTTAEVFAKQFGRQDLFQMPSLPLFRYKLISGSTLNKEYHIQTDQLFINSAIRDEIYLGNLVSHTTQEYPKFPFFTGYNFNPITVSTSSYGSKEVARTYTPSSTAQKAFVEEILVNPPQQFAYSEFDNGTTTFITHKQLHNVGIANLGIKLDEVVSGASYKDQEMTKRQGLIYCFKHTLFTLDMDIPEKLIKESLKETDKDVSYVSSMSYGKVGLLIIESNNKTEEVKTAIFRILNDDNIIRDMDLAIIEAASIAYVYFNNNGEVQVNKNGLEAVKAYNKALSYKKDRANIYPVNFSLADFHTNENSIMSFSFYEK